MSYDSIETFRQKRDEALHYIQQQTDLRPEYVIVLGTGLGKIADKMQVQSEIPYEEIPHFGTTTVEQHEGKLLFGELAGKEVVAMQGRFHYYEGYTMKQIVFPLRVLYSNGAETLFISNACGGMNANYRRGDIMLIRDHINMMGDNPLIGPNDEEMGTRFPDMSEPYTGGLIELAEQVALEESIQMHKGVYAAFPGPMLETRAEYRMMRLVGADVVGMSTVPEVLAAVHMEMDVLGISVITDECFPDCLEPVVLEDVLEAAGMAEPQVTNVIAGVLHRL